MEVYISMSQRDKYQYPQPRHKEVPWDLVQCSVHYLPRTPLKNNWIRDNRTCLPRKQILWIVCTGNNSFDKARDLLKNMMFPLQSSGKSCWGRAVSAQAMSIWVLSSCQCSSNRVLLLILSQDGYARKRILSDCCPNSLFILQTLFKPLAMIIKVKKLSTLRSHANHEGACWKSGFIISTETPPLICVASIFWSWKQEVYMQ